MGEHREAFFGSCQVVGTYTPGKAVDEIMAQSQQYLLGSGVYEDGQLEDLPPQPTSTNSYSID